jgi:2-iminobutanoate/2-iminopropanoate deaminase
MKLHETAKAPAALGPYSQAVSTDGWLFTAGQIGLDPKTGELVKGGLEAETSQVLQNLRAILATADADFSNVVKATLYMYDLGAFATLNGIYEQAMGDHRPARSTVEVRGLPKGALVEIDLIARL